VIRERILSYIDAPLVAGLLVLVVFLPIAHTETIRALALGIPLGLWVIKMILNRRWLFSRTPLDWPVLLFTVVAGLSVLTALDPRYSLEEFIGEWLTGVILFYLLVNNLRREHLKYLLGALFLGNLLMVTYGPFDFFRAGGQLFDYKVRAGSLHSGFGTFGTYLVTAIPYILAAFFLTRQNLHRSLLALLLGLNFFCLYITHSRGSWVAAAFLLFMAGWKFLPRWFMLISMGFALLVMFGLAPKGILWHTTPVSGPGAPGGSVETGSVRLELTKFTLREIWENPIRMLGFGQRSFIKKYRDFYLKYKGAQLWHAHNTFLNISLQTGLQGLLFFCLFLYRLLRYCYTRANLEECPLPKFFLTATFMMILTFLVRNLSDDFFVDDSALLFWLLSGAGVAMAKPSEGNP
jgi:O-antigen ligase